jgi:hypothetical protein
MSIDAALSNLTLTVPREIGVRHRNRGRGAGQRQRPRLAPEGTAWVNDAGGDSEVELIINVNIGLGNSTLVEE